MLRDASGPGRRDASFAMAGLTPDDVDVAELYDPFSFEIIRQLETFGFCPEGEGGAFVNDGNIAPDGRLPVTTDGGTMSFSHAGIERATAAAGDPCGPAAARVVCHPSGRRSRGGHVIQWRRRRSLLRRPPLGERTPMTLLKAQARGIPTPTSECAQSALLGRLPRAAPALSALCVVRRQRAPPFDGVRLVPWHRHGVGAERGISARCTAGRWSGALRTRRSAFPTRRPLSDWMKSSG